MKGPEKKMAKKLILNFVEDGAYMRDHEIEPALMELIEWMNIDIESPEREDYYPDIAFGAENIENLLSPIDSWKNYTLSNEWLIRVSQELIILVARVLLKEGKFKDIKLIIQNEGENIPITETGSYKAYKNLKLDTHEQLLDRFISSNS